MVVFVLPDLVVDILVSENLEGIIFGCDMLMLSMLPFFLMIELALEAVPPLAYC